MKPKLIKLQEKTGMSSTMVRDSDNTLLISKEKIEIKPVRT